MPKPVVILISPTKGIYVVESPPRASEAKN